MLKIPCDRAWGYTRVFSEAFAHGEGGDDIVTVDLPHTCAETPYDYFDESAYAMVSGYRRRLTVPEDWRGKRVFLCVGAAGHTARVFVDGRLLGEHRCGYTAFETELTDALTPGGEAIVALSVDSRETQDIPPFGHVIDYMTYGGLYREAWLEVREQSFIGEVFVKPRIPADKALLTGRETPAAVAAIRFEGHVDCRVTLCGAICASMRGYSLRQRVYRRGEESGAPLVERVFSVEASRALSPDPPRAEAAAFDVALTLPVAALWDVLSPTMYTLTTELLSDGELLDAREDAFGFRRTEFRADGFYLNGRALKLRGLNRHQSYPYVGYAMPRSVQRYDAELLKYELGVNAVRTSHYPQSQHFIERCDELGLLVFTEIPGWQHIGGETWKDQAVKNTEEMVLQYRNHPSIVLWGVRVNESQDDDALYRRTNAAARRLDGTRPTGGVRYLKKSSFLEDVYTYNDFSYDGRGAGCEKKGNVVPVKRSPYLISEYNGHMFPTKTFDDEEHRLEHALRHAQVLDAVAGERGIAGSFGWCMFDYNTHRDFGSGDRICYHGVMDMFRNPKLAAAVYASQQDERDVLEVSSSMEIGEHPASNLGRIFVFTNADAVRLYKNGRYINEFRPGRQFKALPHPPIEIDDLIGDVIEENEDFAPRQAKLVKDVLNHSARFGSAHLPLKIMCKALVLMLRWRMTFSDAYALYGKYVGSWGDEATVYRFDAVKNGVVTASVTRAPMTERRLRAEASSTTLREDGTYDAALIRLTMRDQNGNLLPYHHGPVRIETEGPIRVLGPEVATLRGGCGGLLVRTVGQSGHARITLTAENTVPVTLELEVTGREDNDAG